MRRLLLLFTVLVLAAGCSSDKKERLESVWTEPELKALQGKTRDEVRELLGEPTGLYTYDAKDRWHYSRVTLAGDQPGSTEQVSVLVYFSKFGEHRATIIEIRRRADE